MNEYGNNDTVWFTVLDPTGAIGPKGSVLEFSAWDIYFEDGGYCDAFVRLHMNPPSDFSTDSRPIIYKDFLTYLNALLIRTANEVTKFLGSQVFRGRGCQWGWEEWNVYKALEIVDVHAFPNADEDTLIKMGVEAFHAQLAKEDVGPMLIKHGIQMLLRRGADPNLKNVYGVSALDVAAEHDLLHLFEPLTAEEEEKAKQEAKELEEATQRRFH